MVDFREIFVRLDRAERCPAGSKPFAFKSVAALRVDRHEVAGVGVQAFRRREIERLVPNHQAAERDAILILAERRFV
jgi:hypothetical protein